MFFKEHVERARMDVCNLGKTEVILGMPWLATYNPEIDWEKGEVKMTWYPPICGKNKKWARERNSSIPRKGKSASAGKGEKQWVRKTEKEKAVEKLVLRKFWRWKRVFGKKELECMPTRKPWDYAIELREGFVPKKEKVYLLSREEREEVQAFVENQLQKGYI